MTEEIRNNELVFLDDSGCSESNPTCCGFPRVRFRTLVWYLFLGLLVTSIGAGIGFLAQKADGQDSALAEPPAPEQTGRDFDLELQIKSFDYIWKKIKTSHWDESKVGAEWETAGAKYRDKLSQTNSVAEARAVMTELIGSLGQSHFGIIPADSYDAMGQESGGGDGDLGLTLRLIEDQLAVTAVRTGSSAERAGVRPGWLVTRIENKASAELIEKLKSAVDGPTRLETLVGMVTGRRLSGAIGDKMELTFRDGQNETKDLELTFQKTPGVKAVLGNLPPIRVRQVVKTLDNQVGYYWFSAFLDPVNVMPKFRKVVRDKNHRGGLIIDLRGNIGGIAAMTSGMASQFTPKSAALGVISMKGGSMKLVANSNPRAFSGPVAVLVDECSISSAEILSGGMQDLKLARVFGRRTAGLALPSVVEKLPNGDGFQYAMADYHSASGKSLEKQGVVPDEEIVLTRDSLLSVGDPVLSRAIDWLAEQVAAQPQDSDDK